MDNLNRPYNTKGALKSKSSLLTQTEDAIELTVLASNYSDESINAFYLNSTRSFTFSEAGIVPIKFEYDDSSAILLSLQQ